MNLKSLPQLRGKTVKSGAYAHFLVAQVDGANRKETSMDWTKVRAGELHAAMQRLRCGFGVHADAIVERINTDLQFAENVGLLLQGLTVNNVDWYELHRRVSGNQFQELLTVSSGLGRVVVDKLPIDRSQPFNPETFIGKGWSIWRGPTDGDGFSGEEEQDPRALALTELDFSRLRLVRTLKEDENVVGGEENLRRLREIRHICLDAKAFQVLWQNRQLLPDLLKEQTNGDTTYIFFHGTTLRYPDGNRGVLCLVLLDAGWRWGYHWLDDDWGVYGPSLVLAS